MRACVRSQLFSYVWLFVTPWTVARQAPLSVEFPRQEYWSGLPFPPPGNLPNAGIELVSPALAGGLRDEGGYNGRLAVAWRGNRLFIHQEVWILIKIYRFFPKGALFVLTSYVHLKWLSRDPWSELMISLEQGSSETDSQLLSGLSSRPWGLPWEDTWLDFLLFICIRAGGHCNCICFISYTIYRKIIKQQERTEVRICKNDTERFRLAVEIRKNQKGPLQGLAQRYETGLHFSQWLSFLEPIFFKRFLLQNRSSIISIKTMLWLHSRYYTLSLSSLRVIIKEAVLNTIKTSIWRNSLVVQWLILRAPNAGGLRSISSQETRSHISQQRSKTLHAATKTQLCCCCSASQLCPTLQPHGL